MITLDDLKFSPHPISSRCGLAKVQFENGHKVRIITGRDFDDNLWYEIYLSPIICKHSPEQTANDILRQIQELPKMNAK